MPEANEDNKVPCYTIEKRGKDGEYSLYFGQTKNLRGYRLCNLSDFDGDVETTVKSIEDGLNLYPTMAAQLETARITIRSRDAEIDRLKRNMIGPPL